MRSEIVQKSLTTQHARVVVALREMILRGELAPGERVAEIAIAERLGVSRTPIRQALPVLAQEGLLSSAGARGYVVRSFSVQDVLDALDVRGALEGLVARRIAESGATPELLRELRSCLTVGDAIFAGRRLFSEGDESRYAEMNGRFHAAIDATASPVVAEALALNDRVPFAAASALAFDKASSQPIFEILSYAHRQHHAIVDALEKGEGGRVEALMREHVQPVKQSLNLLRTPQGMLQSAPGKPPLGPRLVELRR
jgi:GntR family transcriptional regulator, vanillate catabolism transcriptional regulator